MAKDDAKRLDDLSEWSGLDKSSVVRVLIRDAHAKKTVKILMGKRDA